MGFDRRYDRAKKPKRLSPKAARTRRLAVINKLKEQKQKEISLVDCSQNVILSRTDIEYVMKTCTDHAKVCTNCDMEAVLSGVLGITHANCKKCGYTFCLETEKNDLKFSKNEALVWGMYVSGSNFEQMKNIFVTLRLPFPTFLTFQAFEASVYASFKIAKEKILAINGKLERELALTNNEFVIVDGEKVPYITVTVDGSWSKRSYGHSYNANSGMAVIIGQRTKRVLWIDTRVKTCQQCSRNSTSETPKVHDCQRNWFGSSQSMETDIIVDGFLRSMKEHGLIYKYVIGDGDSSVYCNIMTRVRYPGVKVQKIECVNHAIKCFNKGLLAIQSDTKYPKYDRDILKSKFGRFGLAARSAIISNSRNQTSCLNPTSSKTLADDLTNMPLHIYGSHNNCNDSFCKRKDVVEPDHYTTTKGKLIWPAIRNVCNLISNKSNRLIYNQTSNICESFMSLVAKYLGGKRINVSQKYGYNIRVLSALFAFDKGSFWLTEIFKLVRSDIIPLQWSLRSEEVKKLRERSKAYKKNARLQPKPARKAQLDDGQNDYGMHANDADMSEQELKQLVSSLRASLQVDVKARDAIELSTRTQSDNDTWFIERRDRITASKAGPIYSLRDQTNNSNMIKGMLYAEMAVELDYSDHRARGLRQEPLAKKKYETVQSVQVQACGLFISLQNGIFAASPDGLVGELGQLEIKCTSIPTSEIPMRKTDNFLIAIGQDLKLKRNHKYFYQVAMQLYCTKRDWCDFVVYYANELNTDERISIERITREETDIVWKQIAPKLERFFIEDLAPEIVNSRKNRNMPFMQPEYRETAIEECRKRKSESQSSSSSKKQKK
jgi:hypothetical protein